MDNETDAKIRQPSINYINWGIGNVINGKIYLHEKLKNPVYDKLRNKIIEHEKAHDMNKKYSMIDMLHDARHTNIDMDLIFFVLSTPSSWLQFSPIIYFNKQLVIDRQTIYLYSLMALAVLIGWKIV